MGRKITFAELDALANRAAKGFQGLGVKPGVHVGLFLPNSPHYAIAFFGVLRAGGVVVNYSPLDAEKVLEHKVADSETDILVTLDLAALYPQMSGLLGRTRVKHLVIGDLAEFSGHPQGVRAHLTAGKQLADVVPDPRHVSFANLLDNDGQPEIYSVADPKETIAVLQYTGGTTGAAEGRDADARQPDGGHLAVRRDYARPSAADHSRRGADVVGAAAIPYLFADGGPVARRSPGRRARAARALRSRGGAARHRDEKNHDVPWRSHHVHRHSQSPRGQDGRRPFAQIVQFGRRAASDRSAERVREAQWPPPRRGLGHDRDFADRHLHADFRTRRKQAPAAFPSRESNSSSSASRTARPTSRGASAAKCAFAAPT